MFSHKLQNKLILILSFCFLLFGCAAKKNDPANIGQPEKDPVFVMLDDAAQRIQSDLKVLSKVQKNKDDYKEIQKRVKAYTIPENDKLSQKISFHWSGPALPALQVLADKIGYKFKNVGEVPAHALPITADYDAKSCFAIIEDIGWKLGADVNVKLDGKQKILQVTFLNND